MSRRLIPASRPTFRPWHGDGDSASLLAPDSRSNPRSAGRRARPAAELPSLLDGPRGAGGLGAALLPARQPPITGRRRGGEYRPGFGRRARGLAIRPRELAAFA